MFLWEHAAGRQRWRGPTSLPTRWRRRGSRFGNARWLAVVVVVGVRVAGRWRYERALDGLLLAPERRLGPRDDRNEARVDIGSDRSSGSHPPGRLTLAIRTVPCRPPRSLLPMPADEPPCS